MVQKNTKTYKLALTGLMAALSYVVFTFLQIKIQLPGGDAAAPQVPADLRDGIVDIHPTMIVKPAVPDGHAHTVKKQGIEQLGVGRKRPELRVF